MKSLFTTSALLACLTSSSVLAANLTIPMSFEYLALDGTEVETSMFNHQSDLALTNGTHKIAIRYHDVVDDSFSDSQTFIKSTPLIVTLTVDGDHQYLLQPAQGDVIKNPKAFAKKPQINIKRQDNMAVTYSVEQTNFTEDSFITSLFNKKNQNDIETLSASATGSGIQPTQTVAVQSDVASATTISAPVIATVPAAAAQKTTPAQAEQMLQYWWLQADDKTRKEFMGWAIKQL
ncbi:MULTISPECIES: DUF2057 domain-containing protein [Shewanella]|jgi:uncharacterized protein YccT (UPF0319 family)|uniref:DUF2057 domain-containing protein n=1 Tax=Shewanella TaxID=22 RepID=UPI000F4F7F59|nr:MULTISPECIES: DUF2057 domain-containing protein [Shewanella]MBB1320464.1 DUF2057 domain-containing protein [Shewanella sp. SR43-8]MBB1474553.1 DUF2057 domain-containing protein [Shewanella sp. SG41-3]RPA51234.1 DUF2057 domain-containing protein [Shewanella vesiculosa]UJL43105.1 DUF2057 domain-containing protein [Shewanella vesiculosa]|tara:strand:+ start:10142 stop:10843 length:702 start_codon:yes stop_codon:yes gene_type:complete